MLMKTILFALLVVAAEAFAPASRVVTTHFGNHGVTTTSRSPAPSAFQQTQIKVPAVVQEDAIHSSTSTQLFASSSKESAFDIPSEAKPFLSASILILLDIAFRQILRKAAISFPSSLAGCGALFVTLLTLPIGQKLFEILSPGAALLAKWLPVFFVPSLITLPLAAGMGSTMEVRQGWHGNILQLYPSCYVIRFDLITFPPFCDIGCQGVIGRFGRVLLYTFDDGRFGRCHSQALCGKDKCEYS